MKEKTFTLLPIMLTLCSATLFLKSSTSTDSSASSDLTADLIYYNGTIITMDKQSPTAETIVVKDGKIIALDPLQDELFDLNTDNTTFVDLKGKTLIPGFIDAHSHFSLTAIQLSIPFSISSPPFGQVTSIPQMMNNIKDYITQNNIPKGQRVYGYGYNDYEVSQHRHPTKYELDWVSTHHPIVLSHYSGHVVVANSLALEMVGYTDKTPSSARGSLDRFANNSITGVCRETAMIPLLARFQITFQDLTPQQIQHAANVYFSVGVTTAQDAFLSIGETVAYNRMGEDLPIDINGYFWVNSPKLPHFQSLVQEYGTAKFKLKGAKLILDGSIQAYTAYLSEVYWVSQACQYDVIPDSYTPDPSRSCQTEKCGINGFPSTPLLSEILKAVANQNIDLVTHCNGDAGIDNYLAALREARSENEGTKSRFIIAHAQTVRQDQLDEMVKLNTHPTFFSPHIYYWGDLHYKIFLGPQRANRMSPVKSAVRRNLTYTLHNDSPVVLMGALNGKNTFIEIIDSAVNRETSGGRVLGQEQKITPYEALAGVTINSAWQAREEDIKGSITVGKVADFVILSANPLIGDGSQLKSLHVITTIKGGKLVYGDYP